MPTRDDRQHDIPPEWRDVFERLVQAFSNGDFGLEREAIDGVEPIDRAEAQRIASNVGAYGDQLAPLHDDVWGSSCCMWMGNHWEVLVDLTTANETVSDLVLHATLVEGRPNQVVVRSIHIP